MAFCRAHPAAPLKLQRGFFWDGLAPTTQSPTRLSLCAFLLSFMFFLAVIAFVRSRSFLRQITVRVRVQVRRIPLRDKLVMHPGVQQDYELVAKRLRLIQ